MARAQVRSLLTHHATGQPTDLEQTEYHNEISRATEMSTFHLYLTTSPSPALPVPSRGRCPAPLEMTLSSPRRWELG